jgi:hypothetical protein
MELATPPLAGQVDVRLGFQMYAADDSVTLVSHRSPEFADILLRIANRSFLHVIVCTSWPDVSRLSSLNG